MVAIVCSVMLMIEKGLTGLVQAIRIERRAVENAVIEQQAKLGLF
jgi:hypothetical protein